MIGRTDLIGIGREAAESGATVDADTLVEIVDELLFQRNRINQLGTYIEHHDWCNVKKSMMICNCGLDEIMEGG